MNNCGTGAEKVCRFVSTRFFAYALNDKVFGLRPKRKSIRSVFINVMCNFEDVTKPPTASLWSGLLMCTHSRGTYTRNVLIRSERSHGERRDKRRARRLYENAWHCVAQAATQAKWYNKGTILVYASADFPSSSDVLLCSESTIFEK